MIIFHGDPTLPIPKYGGSQPTPQSPRIDAYAVRVDENDTASNISCIVQNALLNGERETAFNNCDTPSFPLAQTPVLDNSAARFRPTSYSSTFPRIFFSLHHSTFNVYLIWT